MRRVIIIVIVILGIGGIYYLQSYFLHPRLSPFPSPTTPYSISHTLSSGTAMYRIGIIPKDFPKTLLPSEASANVSARKTVYPTGAVQISMQYQMAWSVDALRIFYTERFAADGWQYAEQLRLGSAVIRATKGIGEAMHTVITATSEGGTKVSVVYSKN